MLPELFYAAVFVFLALMVCAYFWDAAKQRQRAREVLEAAQRIGFSFVRDGQSLLDEELAKIPIFNRASLRGGRVSNLLRGQSGSFSIAICEYRYWTEGEDPSCYEQTVFCFDVKGAGLPDFSLGPELSALERKVLTFGLRHFRPKVRKQARDRLDQALAELEEKGVKFPGHPDFSARYHLRAPDAEAAKVLFQEGIVQRFEQQPQRRALLSVEKAGNWLVVYRKNVVVKPEDLGAALNEAASIRALFPTLGR